MNVESNMKYVVICLICLLIPTMVTAKKVTLNWDASPTAEVTGYKVHYATSPDQPFPVVLDVGDVLTAQIVDLPDETAYYFAVSAYNAAGMESTYSNVVLSHGFTIPEAPAGLGGTTEVNNVILPIE